MLKLKTIDRLKKMFLALLFSVLPFLQKHPHCADNEAIENGDE